MDVWASLEHDICYKVNKSTLLEGINEEICVCDKKAEIDRQM